jgi:hypothetical protein
MPKSPKIVIITLDPGHTFSPQRKPPPAVAGRRRARRHHRQDRQLAHPQPGTDFTKFSGKIISPSFGRNSIQGHQMCLRIMIIMVARDRCYMIFYDIFAERFSEKIGFFDSKQS